MKQRAFIYIIIAGVLWGTSGIFVRALAPFGYSSIQMSMMRSGVSLLVMAGYALICRRRAFRTTLPDLGIFALAGVGLFGCGSCYYASMQLTNISTAVVLMYTAPIYVMIFSVLFLGEKLTRGKAAAVGIMLAGCALVSGIAGGMRFDAAGILLGVLSGISYGAYNIMTKISMRRGTDPVSATLYTFMFAALICLCACNIGEFSSITASAPAKTLPLIISIGIVTYVAPYVFYTLAMKVLPAGTASALGIVEPMAATVIGMVAFSEIPDMWAFVGIVLILGAVLLLSRTDEGEEKDPASGDQGQ